MRALILLLLSFPAWAEIQTEWTLFRNAQTPLEGSPSGQWNWPGAAFSASTLQLYSHLSMPIQSCRWAYSLNPNTGPSPTGIRLVSYDSGNVVEMARVLIANRTTPTSGGHDITQQMRNLLAQRKPLTIAMQSVGNGIAGPKIYHSVIECIWQ